MISGQSESINSVYGDNLTQNRFIKEVKPFEKAFYL